MKRLFIGDVVSNNNCSSGSGNILRLGQLERTAFQLLQFMIRNFGFKDIILPKVTELANRAPYS